MQFETFEFNDAGFKVLMHYDTWRVAILNFVDDCKLDGLHYVEAHLETDEVFVLLEGEATLVFADIKNDVITQINAVKLEKNKVYNIKKGIYHTQLLSTDAKLLIVEAKDTGDSNSIKHYLSTNDLKLIKEAL